MSRTRRILRRFRDALTGRYTSKDDADARPGETVGESIDRERVGERRTPPRAPGEGPRAVTKPRDRRPR